MARAKDQKNGRLEEALTALVQNQATLVQTQAAFAARLAEADARMAETHARMVETDRINAERFARIERILLEHSHILGEHTRMLEALPEAIRQKIGFPAQPRTAN